MKNGLLAVGALAILVFGAQQAAAQGAQVGVSAAVRGDVAVATGQQTRQAASGQSMFLGDLVRSAEASGMQLLLLDETTFTIGENCQMTIDQFVYDPSTSSGTIAARLTKGALRFVSGQVARNAPQNVSITAPSGVIGIRGTSGAFFVGAAAVQAAQASGLSVTGFDPENALLAVLQGPGRERNTLDRKGRISVTAGGTTYEATRSGVGIFVPAPGAAPLPPIVLPEGVLQALFGQFDQGARPQTRQASSGGVGNATQASGQARAEGAVSAAIEQTIQDQQEEVQEEVAQTGTVTDDDDDEPIGSGIFNNVGLQIANWELASQVSSTLTFDAEGVALYEQGDREVFGDNSSINVYGDEGRSAVGSYDVSVTIDPNAATVSSTFSNIDAADHGLDNDSISNVTSFGPTGTPAFITFGSENGTSGCVAASCSGAVDLLGNPRDLITGVTHSLQIGSGDLLGTGVITEPSLPPMN